MRGTRKDRGKAARHARGRTAGLRRAGGGLRRGHRQRGGPSCRPGLARAVNEVAALVEGGTSLAPQARAIVEIGGQTAKYVTGFSATEKSRVEVSINSNCASGTGAFLEEQVSRLGLPIEDFSLRARQASNIPRIAGRCSVFAKTDVTHHQQEGVPVADILLGLAHAVVRNYRGAVMRKLPLRRPILFAGGVSRNEAILGAFRTILELPPQEFLAHEHGAMAAAIGAALMARERGLSIDVAGLVSGLRDIPCPSPVPRIPRPAAAGRIRPG